MGGTKSFLKASQKNVKRTIKKAGHQATTISKSITNTKRYSKFIRILGPGVVTGAADDDPSGIATYSQVGATQGLSLLWPFPLLYPLLLAVQESCSRIGAVTGKGLAGILKANYSKKTLYLAVSLVVVANTINIGADLGAMAEATKLIVPASFTFLAVFFALAVIGLEIFLPYRTYAKILKWLALTILAYPITAFLIGQNWGEAIKATFATKPKLDFETLYLFVGLIGTTVSPYLFFWDTSEVVEEEIKTHRATINGSSPKITKKFLRSIRMDNFVGMTIAIVTAWFIVIVCSKTLFSAGIKDINTAADAARALEPLVKNFPNAGFIAKLIFSIGIVGLGLLAVPVLAGSASYAISETLGWKEGLYRNYKQAVGFYAVIALSTLIGLSINFLGIDPIKALIFSAVFNCISAVPLLFMIARVGNNKQIMGEYKNGFLSNLGVRTAFTIMAASVVILFYAMITNKV